MMATPPHSDRASFYRAALLLGLVRGETVVGWSDAVVGADAVAPDAGGAFVEIATIPPGDLTALRIALLRLCGEREPPAVVGALLGLIGRQLSSGRRSFADTLRVLRQMRQSLKLDASLADTLRQFEIDRYVAGSDGAGAVESDVRRWLALYEGTEAAYLEDNSRS